ncbi:DUF4126 domain-containing protein [Actinocorallia populi]|uniref:DUF4126 domain-containing protein n=1 Tax=Actinocorallia populi TaxID=2079200 RepID=UPI000D090D7B|nr:DUF4126 domain-containing protein [Actinocorallia populi]
MFAFLTGLGLAGAAGLNAYIPILVVGLLGRYTGLVVLPAEFSWMGNGWVLAGLSVLLAAEMVLDKVPLVDSVNDAVMTLVRPAAGGAAAAATAAAADLDAGLGTGLAPLQEHTWLSWVPGVLMALAVHVLKTVVRPIANTGTAGTAAPVLSTAEDGLSLGLSLLAVLAPALVLLLLPALLYTAFRLLRRARRRKRAPAPG